MSKPASCDIFCAVVDNYGDIGVCWRLAKQLANEHGVAVRLWLDDLASLQRLCPEVNASLAQQHSRGVEIRHWIAEAFASLPSTLSRLRERGAVRPGEGRRTEIMPADLVIETFACELPELYVVAMANQQHKPVWINLEYLSGENWVEGCHRLPSPHPRLPLVKYFFFPGFTAKTGGLLLEHDLLARRDAFQRNPQAMAAYWQAIGVPVPQTDELRVSLFSYENPALPELLGAWEQGAQPVTCLVPEGRSLPQVAAFFGGQQGRAGDTWQRGKLRVHVLPFVEQERYDQLLWACDINFVRGEDSFVRAQWAARPFVWHIYPQHDGVHMQKLHAFMALFCAGLPPDAGRALHALWEVWNGAAIPNPVRPELVEGQMGFDRLSPNEPPISSGQIDKAWNDFRTCQSMLLQQAQGWAHRLSGNNLALNLLDFFREIGKMRDFEI